LAIGELFAVSLDARLLFELGRTVDGSKAAARARELAAQIGSEHGNEVVAASLALDRAARGEAAGAAADLETAIQRGGSLGFGDAQFEERLALARIEADRGRDARAAQILAELETDARKRGYLEIVSRIQAFRSRSSANPKLRSARK